MATERMQTHNIHSNTHTERDRESEEEERVGLGGGSRKALGKVGPKFTEEESLPCAPIA